MGDEPYLLTVRPCRESDLRLLEQTVPTGYHEARFARPGSAYLVAVRGGAPVGAGELWWHPKEPAVRERFPDCPEINGLTVGVAHQSRGAGTALVQAAERLAAERGRVRIGLGVDDQNVRAAALYGRLGYVDVGCEYLDRYHYLDDSGARHEVADACRFLVKALAG
ncbi:GNAT family N-acetyltransferase [Paractinoplanes rishiriensis]|uniref:N-acetyltransferase domain-containing protein n=1 Tax=Paractinoplanes rishiriensis TaxID=1050105 RepID=A0A919JU27_9ACTN|nr:GNAT family N-acetyltransferase [Actinoplanes rishiriensis]GIE95206.1 hypothetical protein Ari01nite_26710 [Actinoplanes rishiriensis]